MDPVDKAVLTSLYATSIDPSVSAYDRFKARLPVNKEFFKSRLSHLAKIGFVEKDDPFKLTFIGRDALRVVLVGGVFDLIHPGHIHTLKAAKEQGDVLVVVVARTSTAQKIKKDRKIYHDESLRKELVASLNFVDIVIVGREGTLYDTVEYVKVVNGTPGTWRIETSAFSLSSAQTYGLAALVILNKANLSISGFTSPAGGSSSSRDFYLYSTVTNNGFAAPGSYVQLQLPNAILYGVKGARIYTADGRSHFYDATKLHHDQGFRNWDVATGETIHGFPRLIRWHLRYAGTDCPSAQINLQAYYRNAGDTVLEHSASVPFSCQQTTYLPLIIK